MLTDNHSDIDGCIAGKTLRQYRTCRADVQQSAQTAGPDISQLDPVLQKQWDHAANKHLGVVVIRPHSRKKVWWQCDQCPDGHLHSWAATLYNRSNGAGCPQCSGRLVCKHSSLRTKAPVVAAEWHPTRNDCGPEDVTASSNRSAVWQCQLCNHVWTAHINLRVGQGTGCPKCSTGFGQSKKTHPTFADSNDPLLTEWDHSRNAALSIFPDKIKLRSHKSVFWLCPNCPAGQQHSYSAAPNNRTGNKRSGCPFCSGRKACKCNSLRVHCPELTLSWDFTKNKGTPDDHTAHSNYMAWWISTEGKSWQQSIHSRTMAIHSAQRGRLIKKYGL